ncbi:MAG TPA: hypothetical protein VFZ59_26060, partial [Verrucomicrobiae bacterium]|nr:hypothetical protein [Verrucomicrobiae bacterium]
AMTNQSQPKTFTKITATAFASIALLAFSSCSSPKPTTPPVVTRVSPGDVVSARITEVVVLTIQAPRQ